MFFLILSLAAFPVFSGQGPYDTEETETPGSTCTGFGVFANYNTNSIQFIDPVTKTLSPSYLKGYLGTYEGGLMDIAITSDGKTAIVSNFGDEKIFFMDISQGFDVEPTLLGYVFIHFPAEDLAITPDDKYVLVTDGDSSSSIAVIEIATMRYVLRKNLCACEEANAVAVAADGETVLASDFWGGWIHVLRLNEDGYLTFVKSYDLWPYWPTNVSISPDGKTVIVPLAFLSVTAVFPWIRREN